MRPGCALFVGRTSGQVVPPPPPPPPLSQPFVNYPAFDRAWIPWSIPIAGAFQEAAPPVTSGPVIVATTLAELHAAMALGGRYVRLADGVHLGNVSGGCIDTEVEIPLTSSIAFWTPSTNFGSTGRHFTTRLRIRGPGKLGGMQFLNTTGTGSGLDSDVIVDGVQFSPTVKTNTEQPIVNTSSTQPSRLMFINCVVRAPAIAANGTVGNCFLIDRGTDIAILNCSTASDPSSGANNSWNFRFVASTRVIVADCMSHKYATQQAIFRHGTGTNVGCFLRNNTFVCEDGLIAKDEDSPYNNSEVYGDLNTFIIQQTLSPDFLGRQNQRNLAGPGIVTDTTLTNMRWRALNSSQVNDARMQSFEQQGAANGAHISLRIGATYTYDVWANLVPPWPGRFSPLTGVTLDGDPAHLT